MVLKAYSSFVCNFSIAMDSIKETCKLVPAFFNFLKVCILIIFFNIYIDEDVARKAAKVNLLFQYFESDECCTES